MHSNERTDHMKKAKATRSAALRGIVGLFLATLIIFSISATIIHAETAGTPTLPEMSDMIPDGTNIPDSDIGGATGTSPLETIDTPSESSSLSPETGSSVPPSSSSSSATGSTPQSTSNNDTVTDDDGGLGRIIGIIVAVIVVLAVIMLIITLIPRRSNGSDSSYDNRRKKQ